jgi:hypothetical protein
MVILCQCNLGERVRTRGSKELSSEPHCRRIGLVLQKLAVEADVILSLEQEGISLQAGTLNLCEHVAPIR